MIAARTALAAEEDYVTEQRVHVWKKSGLYYESGPALRTAELAPLVPPPGAPHEWRMVAVVQQSDDFVTIYWQRERVVPLKEGSAVHFPSWAG